MTTTSERTTDFTPGPWEATKLLVVAPGSLQSNAVYHGKPICHTGGFGNNVQEALANAALVAAAPEMFAVCEAIATDDWAGLISLGRNMGASLDWHGVDDLAEYEHKGGHEDDARYTYPHQGRLIYAVLAAVISKAVTVPQ